MGSSTAPEEVFYSILSQLRGALTVITGSLVSGMGRTMSAIVITGEPSIATTIGVAAYFARFDATSVPTLVLEPTAATAATATRTVIVEFALDICVFGVGLCVSGIDFRSFVRVSATKQYN
jgi:hypothetical protein